MDTYMTPPAAASAAKRGPAYKRTPVLGRQKELHWQTFFMALGTAAVFILPFMLVSHGIFLYRGDFNVQQVTFYQMCHQMVKEGNIFWNWQTDLGVNFIGSYSFYLLGSPFFWLTIPFPNWMVPYLIGPLLMLKFALAAFTAYFYIRRFTRTPSAAMLGALLYAFSGFSVHNLFFNHFHEPIIFFPLLLLAVEQFISDNRRGAVAVAVFICAVSNYFFFVGMAVFCVIYWFIRMFAGAWDLSLKRFLAFIAEVLLGVGLAAFLLVPSYLTVMQNRRVDSISAGWTAFFYSNEHIYGTVLRSLFFPPDITGNTILLPDENLRWSSSAAWLPIFSMTGVVGYVWAKKGNWLRRMLLVLLAMALVPVLNSAFVAFNAAYYARWFYMPVLMMCLATAMSLEDREVNWKKAFTFTAAATGIMILILAFFPAEISNGQVVSWGLFDKDTGSSHDKLIQFLVICGTAVLSLLLLRWILRLRRKNPRQFTRTAAACICLLSAAYGFFFVQTGRPSRRDIEENYLGRLIQGEVTLPGNSDEYRIDVYDGLSNTGLALGYRSIQAFHSIVPASIMEYYPYVGVERGVASRPEVEAYAVRPLLSVKYLLSPTTRQFVEDDGRTKMPGYTFLEEQNGFDIYENENYIPYGFTYDYYMTYAECDSYEEDQRSLLMLKAMLLTDEQVERHGDILTDLGADYRVSGSTAGGLQGTDLSGLTAEEIMSQAREEASSIPELDFSDEAFAADCAARAKTAAKSFATDNRGFTAEVELERENLVFFSVPYEEGWTATVDGQPAVIEEVNVGFMAVRVPEGAHTVRFSYMTPGLKNGCLITVGALVLFAAYMAGVVWLRRRRPESFLVEYPEGDQLAQRFAEDKAAEEAFLAEWEARQQAREAAFKEEEFDRILEEDSPSGHGGDPPADPPYPDPPERS